MDLDAARRAFELIVRDAADHLIVAEIQDSFDDLASLALEADEAFARAMWWLPPTGTTRRRSW